MTEAVLFISVGSVLTVGIGTLTSAALVLRKAWRTVELAEDCMKYLREEQARLLILLREERQIPREEPEQRRERRLGTQQKSEHLDRERLLLQQEQRRLAQELEQERRVRRDAERRIDHLKRELQEVQQDQEIQRESFLPVTEGLSKGLLGTHELSGKKTLPTQKGRGAGRTSRPTSFPETTASGPVEVPPKDRKPRLGVRIPHPDDGVEQEKASAGQARAQSGDPVEMFRKHYDKYLENYRGYVELAERLYRMRDNGEMLPGSVGGREWEEKLRRVNDGIERTTARLDILEEHNPGLATDDERISQRTSIARRHSELERKRRDRKRS